MSLKKILFSLNSQHQFLLPFISPQQYFYSTAYKSDKGNKFQRSNLNPEIRVRQDDVIEDAIKNFRIKTNKEWEALKQNVLGQGNIINNVNFDAKVMGFCLAHKNMIAAQSYLNYIKSNDAEPNIATIGKLLRLHYSCNENCDHINKNSEDEILNIYNNLKSSTPVLEPLTAENAIHALSLTKEWKECLELLDTVKISAKPAASTYSVIIRTMFKNKESNKAWDMMDHMIACNRLPLPIVYHALLDELKNSSDIQGIEKLIQWFEDNDVHPTKCVLDKLSEILKKHSYETSYTKLIRNCTCSGCKNQLNDIKISNEDFELLRKTFFKNVIIGKNIFNKTSPEELENFKQFLNKLDNYDIVIDGLNVAYCAGIKKPVKVYVKMISSVIGHFLSKSKKVLLLGRVHMSKWPNMNYVKANSYVFLAQNLSQDDPFLLYAAMEKGLGTCFLSKDLMRGHSYLLLDANLKRLFRRWQQSHQYSLIYVENDGRVHVKHPSQVLPTAQVSKHGWHIPYVTEHLYNPPNSFDTPTNWLCIKKK